MNASTFTARVIASTGADVAAALSGAVGAMSGPLHGGAPARVLGMIEEVEWTGDAEQYVTSALDRGERTIPSTCVIHGHDVCLSMAIIVEPLTLSAIEVPKLGRLERVKLSVPVLEGVPFAIVELDGARDQRQTLRLDLDKRRFLDLPERD